MLSLLLICVNAVATMEAEHARLAEDVLLLHASNSLTAGDATSKPVGPESPGSPPSPPTHMRAEADAPESPRGPPQAAPTAPPAAEAAPAAAASGAAKSGSERMIFSADLIPFIKFVGKQSDDPNDLHGAHYLVLLDQLEIKVPEILVYVVPVICFAALFATWLLCCFRSDRSGFSCRLAVESVMCFPCLWAELATKFKAASACRNWTYVYTLMALLCLWCASATYFERKDIVAYVFYPLLLVFWAAFTYERVHARKIFRRTIDPFTESHTVSDCTVTMCCAPMSAMQEAHIMASMDPPQSSTKPDAW